MLNAGHRLTHAFGCMLLQGQPDRGCWSYGAGWGAGGYCESSGPLSLVRHRKGNHVVFLCFAFVLQSREVSWKISFATQFRGRGDPALLLKYIFIFVNRLRVFLSASCF